MGCCDGRQGYKAQRLLSAGTWVRVRGAAVGVCMVRACGDTGVRALEGVRSHVWSLATPQGTPSLLDQARVRETRYHLVAYSPVAAQSVLPVALEGGPGLTMADI